MDEGQIVETDSISLNSYISLDESVINFGFDSYSMSIINVELNNNKTFLGWANTLDEDVVLNVGDSVKFDNLGLENKITLYAIYKEPEIITITLEANNA